MNRFPTRKVIRFFAFLVFVAALTGPWAFDSVNVPAKYACDYRLESDFCGIPMSGFQVLAWVGSGIVDALFNSIDQHRISEYLLEFFFLLPVFPFISNILMILKQKSQLLQFINVICWALAGLLFLLLLLIGLGAKANFGWGIWLYDGLAIGMACTETMFMRRISRTK